MESPTRDDPSVGPRFLETRDFGELPTNTNDGNSREFLGRNGTSPVGEVGARGAKGMKGEIGWNKEDPLQSWRRSTTQASQCTTWRVPNRDQAGGIHGGEWFSPVRSLQKCQNVLGKDDQMSFTRQIFGFQVWVFNRFCFHGSRFFSR